MRILILTVGVLAFLLLSAELTMPRQTSCLIVDNQSPAVYISFEKRSAAKDTDVNRHKDVYWLRLHNNTSHAIQIETETLYLGDRVLPLTLQDGSGVLALREGTEAVVCYMVESLPRLKNNRDSTTSIEPALYQKLPMGIFPDINAVAWIPSASSIMFSVPAPFLTERRRIVIPFHFEWEKSTRNIEHLVYFYAHEIPSEQSSVPVEK